MTLTHDEMLEKAKRWTQAISEEAFCGQPSRYEDAYESLLKETHKLEALNAGEIDWGVVAQLSDELTVNKTKDMYVLGTLCAGETVANGPSGLAAALFAYRQLVAEHSKDLFPNQARKRGRAGALSWMIRQLEIHLEKDPPSLNSHDAYVLAFEQMTELDQLFREELAEEHPSSKSVRDILQRYIQATSDEESDSQTSDHNDSASRLNSDELVMQDRAPAFSSALEERPETHALSDHTSLPNSIRSERDADTALKSVVQTLKKTSEFFMTFGGEDKGTIAYNLAQYASLLDGTEIWEKPEPINVLIAEGKRIAKAKGVSEGCKLLEEVLKSAGTKVSRFRLRLAMAQICLEGSAAELAKPILQELKEELAKPLSEFLPELSVEHASTTLLCNSALIEAGDQDHELIREKTEMLHLLARLAPGKAFEVR